jgi:hypothetical protein
VPGVVSFGKSFLFSDKVSTAKQFKFDRIARALRCGPIAIPVRLVLFPDLKFEFPVQLSREFQRKSLKTPHDWTMQLRKSIKNEGIPCNFPC